MGMDVAAKLREREISSIRVQVEHDLVETVFKSLDERGGAQELVRQQYSGRYPFELLQNANDAALNTGKRGRATFLLTETALIVADNGFGFGEEQVEAICSLGRSSKDPGTSVGHKGLGFKSVGEISDRPQVVSRQASFQFDGERVRQTVFAELGNIPEQQKFPVYAFPFPIEDRDLGADVDVVAELLAAEWTTVIRLPFRDGIARETVADHLVANLLPRLLLFLHGVDHLELRGTHADFAVEVSRDSDGPVEHVLLEIEDRDEEWLIYRGEVAPDASILAPLGAAWAEIGGVSLAVAVPLDASGYPSLEESFPLHVYFPTDERPGTHLAIHAEWALSMDRRQLASTPEAVAYNGYLLEEVAAFLAETVAADLIGRTGASKQAIQALVPTLSEPTSGSATRLRERWCRALSRTPFLPSIEGAALQMPGDMQLLPRKLPSLAAAHAVADLHRSRTLRPDVEALEPVRVFLLGLGVEEMRLSEFLAHLRQPTRTTLDAYYEFLVDWRNSLGLSLVAALRKLPSVLSTNGDLLAPADGPVFLPRVRGDSAIPHDIPVPIAEMPDVDGAESLLRELGVKSFEWRELIREFLIGILADPDADPTERARAMVGLRAYHAVRLSGSEDLAQGLSRVLLPARSSDGSARGLRAGGELYFDASWTGSEDLETIYGPFRQTDFLDIAAPLESDERETDRSFYRMLGVADHPRLDVAQAAERASFMVDGIRHPHRGPVFKEWLSHPAVAEAARCPQGHPASQQLKRSIVLDRLLELVESKDPVRLIALWKQLGLSWGNVFEPEMTAIFHCIHGSHVGERDRRCESLLAYVLGSRAWVPVARAGVADVVCPEEAWIESQETPRHIKERIPRISAAMFQTRGGAAMAGALRLTDAARPKVRDLLILLSSVGEEAGGSGEISRETELSARYIQRTLNDVLADDTELHPKPDSVRLLASFQGAKRFIAQPPYAEDPLLRDTWERQRPVLAAEAGLSRLTRYLSLSKLDDVVETIAVPYGEHTQGSALDQVRRKIRDIKPYILALVRSENARAESSARRALNHLELIVCDRLALQYAYDGIEVERGDAVCYIAVRKGQEGTRRGSVGTAYLELEEGQPHWFPLGRQLAQYLGVPALSDAITMLLTTSIEDRDRMMADRHIPAADIDDARHQLGLEIKLEEDIGNVLDDLAPALSGERASRSSGAGLGAAQGMPSLSDAAPSARATPASEGGGHEVTVSVPDVDYESLRITEGEPEPFETTVGATRHFDSRGGAVISTAPSIGDVEDNRRVGKRGEKIAYMAERARLRGLGKNPDLAIWVSETDELSPFDLKSIDADGQVIYIEVKSTKGSAPGAPFYISHSELVEASFHRERYYIYRVTSVDTASPQVTRLSDPLRLVKDGKGRLLLAKAHMELAFAGESAVFDRSEN
ncbi:sacsin N-terminal ATP-binding-like domain-containing protein [Arthrobacter sp. KK5.5]|uniref:DUF3883 domain-containing protein n=1 Tax=Arthrobacter sp. KK5.5 TaxID=3373084 RepID=UPI003EE6257D